MERRRSLPRLVGYAVTAALLAGVAIRLASRDSGLDGTAGGSGLRLHHPQRRPGPGPGR